MSPTHFQVGVPSFPRRWLGIFCRGKAGARLYCRPAAALRHEGCVKFFQAFRQGDALRLIPLHGTQPRSGEWVGALVPEMCVCDERWERGCVADQPQHFAMKAGVGFSRAFCQGGALRLIPLRGTQPRSGHGVSRGGGLPGRFSLVAALVLFLLAQCASAGEANTWSLSSPDGQCEISVSLADDGSLSYQTARAGKVVIPKSALGLQRDDQDFAQGLVFKSAGGIETRHERYDLFAGTRPHVDDVLNHRRLLFRNARRTEIELDLAASDQGVAFRYRFPERSLTVRIVESEATSFTLPADARGWMQPYHAAGPYTPAYEDFFFPVSPGDPPPDSRAKAVGWAFPALFHVPAADTWVLLTESGTDASYCACHLNPDCRGGVYRIAFPLADETTQRHTNEFGPEPRFTLPWTLPWRVIVMTPSAGDIALETLVTDLAPPSRIAHTSWIKPGRASWAWWSYPDGPVTTNLFDQFTDLAASMGWEYTLFDAGWWTPGIKPIAHYAEARGIMPLAWMYAGDFYDPASRRKQLDQMQDAGVRGIKVDFWCSDRQETIAAQQALMRDTAARHMVLNLHGCTIPRGWQRTWPNFLSCEAVLGSESYFYESRYTEKAAELDTVLPFIRNAVGPMDLTPVACSPKKYARTTTAAHQLAAALIFTCGIVHYADSPEFFHSLPPAVQKIFRDAPARWDETRCLAGEPGSLAVFARRSGQNWFIAGINGTTNALPVDLDLSAFKDFHQRLAVTEGADAIMQVVTAPLADGNEWKHTIPARGGFILRLDR